MISQNFPLMDFVPSGQIKDLVPQIKKILGHCFKIIAHMILQVHERMRTHFRRREPMEEWLPSSVHSKSHVCIRVHSTCTILWAYDSLFLLVYWHMIASKFSY